MLSVKTPFQERAEAVKEIREWMTKFFAREPKWNSVLMCVAQYWNDEANDAVHCELIASTRLTPTWAFDIDDDDEGRTPTNAAPIEDARISTWNLEESVGNFPIDNNSTAVRPFQALCREGSSQESNYADAYLPAYVFRRDGSVHFVGEIVRPWLDLPRAAIPSWIREEEAQDNETENGNRPGAVPELIHLTKQDVTHLDSIAQSHNSSLAIQVYADALVSKGDIRGTFISLCNAAQKTPEIENEKQELQITRGEQWLSNLIHVVPLSTADFSTGVMTSCSPHFDSTFQKHFDSPLFATVKSIHFASGEERLTAHMKSLTHITGLSDLGPLQKFPFASQITHLGLRSTAPLAGLKTTGLLALESVDLGVDFETVYPRVAAVLSALPGLQTLRVMVAPSFDEYGNDEYDAEVSFQELLSKIGTKHQSLRCVLLTAASSASRPTGIQLSFTLSNPTQIELSCLGLCRAARQEEFKFHLGQLPAGVEQLRVVESIHLMPNELDKKQMSQWSKCQLV
jgi:hypothetical protein